MEVSTVSTPLKEHLPHLEEIICEDGSPKLSNASTEKNTPPRKKLGEFPQLRCSIHKNPVILVCTKLNCKHRIFLCAKCVSSELVHINIHDPLMVYDEFIEFLNQEVVLESRADKLFEVKEECCEQDEEKLQRNEGPANIKISKNLDLLQKKDEIIRSFNSNIYLQKVNMSQAVNMLQGLYTEKIEELNEKMNEVFDKQSQLLQENLDNFEQEALSSKQGNVNIPPYEEIRDNVKSMKDLREIEFYLTSIKKRKQTWKSASEEIKSLGRRTEAYYKSIIEQQIENPPRFLNPGTIIGLWTVGLSRLIEQIINEGSVYENLIKKKEGIEARIASIEELMLFSDKMLKTDTILNINLERTSISAEECSLMVKTIKTLKSLRNLVLNLEQVKFERCEVSEILETLPELTQLKSLNLNYFGQMWPKKETVEKVVLCLGNLPGLTSLNLVFAENLFNDQTIEILSKNLSNLALLEDLSLNLNSNNITSKGAQFLAQGISQLRNLNVLFLGMGGYSLIKNNLRDEGVSAIAQMFKHLKKLKHIDFDLAHNGLADNGLIELGLQLGELTKLESLSLKFSNNNVRFDGVKKLGKCLTKLTNLKYLEIGANSNEIGLEGAQELVKSLKKMSELRTLKLNFRNSLNNSKKEKNKTLKDDLETAKVGKPLEKLELLF